MLIDRDKAIEAIEAKEANEFGNYREYNVAFNDGLRSAVFALEELPSAEPQGDLISREKLQTQLNCVDRLQMTIDGRAIEVIPRWNVNKIIENLPSAESEVIRCKDCKYHMGEGCCDYWDEGRMFLDISDSDYCSKAERRTE